MDSKVSKVARQVLERCLCKRTRAAARAITRLYDEELRATGLTPSQVELLVTVAALSELSITALADELGLDRTSTTRNLRLLEMRKLIALSPEGRNRIRLVRLTPAGEAALVGAIGHWHRAQEAMERRLGKEGVRAVRQAAAAITSSSRDATRL